MASSDPELEAVERVFTSLAIAATDAELQAVLTTLLPGLLAALATPSPAARARIMDALQHINTRLRAAPDVSLPLQTLITMYKAKDTPDITRNFLVTAQYLERAFDRASSNDKAGVALELIVGAGSYPKPHLSPVMRLAIRSMAHTPEQDGRKNLLKEIRARQQSPRDLAFFVGISLRGLLRELKPSLEDSELVALVLFLTELSPTTVCPHLVVAAADVKSPALAHEGDNALKRLGGSADIEKNILIDSMFNLFDRNSIHLRCDILSRVLLRSTAAADRFPGNLKVITESVNSPSSSPKLRSLGMSFVSWVISHSSPDNLKTYGPILLAGILKIIQDGDSSNFPVAVRLFAFTAVSDFAVRRGEVFSEDLAVPQLCFEIAMRKESSDEIRAAAVHTLSSLSRVYEKSSATTKAGLLDQLKSIFKDLEAASIPVCTVALKLVNHWFPFSDPEARHLCVVAAGDYRPEVGKIGRISLQPTRHKGDELSAARSKNIDFPLFGEMLSVVERNQIELQQYADRPMSAPIRVTEAARFKETIWLLLRCFEYSLSGGGSAAVNVEHDATTRMAIEEDDVLIRQIGRLFSMCHNVLLSCKETIRDKNVSELSDICLVSVLHLLETGAIRRQSATVRPLSNEFQSELWEIAKERSGLALDALCKYSGFIFHNVEEGAEAALQSLVYPVLKQLCLPKSAKKVELSHFVLAAETIRGLSVDQVKCLNLTTPEKVSIRQSLLDLIGDKTASLPLRISGAKALGSFVQSKIVTELLLSDEHGLFDSTKMASELTTLLKDKNIPSQVADAVATAVSKIFFYERDPVLIETVCQSFIAVGESKIDENLSFSVGEGLIRLAFGQELLGGKGILDDEATMEEVLDQMNKKWSRPMRLGHHTLVDELVTKKIVAACAGLCHHVKPHARSAGCVYLFSLLRHVEKLSTEPQPTETGICSLMKNSIQSCLPESQAAFSLLLSEKNDFTQQLAAKGLSAVYNLSSEKLRQEMVSSLVKNLTSSKARGTASIVAGDEGTIETGAPDGPSSYKEMCSLCNDLGQPELIYKFLDIAGHGAVWNNRRGAALVGETVFQSELAAEQLRPHFGSLFPKLFLYSYDPAAGVRMSMNGILKSLTVAVGYSSVMAALDDHLTATLDFLLESMGSRQWRIREAATAALRDSLPSRKFEAVKFYIEKIWYMIFRAMDDIKESVRIAGQGCARAAVALSSRLCNPRLTVKNDSEQAAQLIVPICLKGYTVGVKETQQISVNLLTEIIKDSGDSLKPLIPSIVQCLLSAATELEPTVLNYAQFHTDSPSDLESARVDAAASSRGIVISSLERILPLVDSTIARELTPILVNLVRTAVGIPSRVATAQFISSLMSANKFEMNQESGKLLDAALGAVFLERTGPLVKMWAFASVHCASAASFAKVGKFFDRLSEEGQSDDERRRHAAATLSSVLSHRRPELLKENGTKVIPLAFVAKNLDAESEKDTAELWKVVWEDNATSEAGAARIFSKEIIELSNSWLGSLSHVLKRAAAHALSRLVSILAQSEESADRQSQLVNIKTILVECLRGNPWEGKDSVVSSLASFAESRETDLVNTRRLIEQDPALVTIFCAEARRGNLKARGTVLIALARILECQLDKTGLYDQVLNLVNSIRSGTRENDPSESLDRVIQESVKCLAICRDPETEVQRAKFLEVVSEFAPQTKKIKCVIQPLSGLTEGWIAPDEHSREILVDLCLRGLSSNEPKVFEVISLWSSSSREAWTHLCVEIWEKAKAGDGSYALGEASLAKLQTCVGK